jgi:hypothetical protein
MQIQLENSNIHNLVPNNVIIIPRRNTKLKANETFNRTFVFKNKMLKLNFYELLLSICICCRTKNIQNRLKKLKSAFERISHKFDWINLVKSQNDINMIKLILFNKEQNNIFAFCTKSSTNKNHVK